MADVKTPIADFVYKYAEKQTARFHMPGHKGVPVLGTEPFDITEIAGADQLYAPDGVIAESEEIASALFGTAHTFYSTEGSTLAIKAMLSLIATRANKERVTVLAARNVHKAFVYAAATLDLDVKWLYPSENTHLCACPVTKEAVSQALSESESEISAVYLTSPDYLGNLADVKGIAEVCRERTIPLLVDNAHGAYLAFHTESLHPIHLGATMTADSAHKTLPVLTGGAYLQIAKDADEYFVNNARSAFAFFASTSPSYLTLASLDLANRYLADGYGEKYAACLTELDKLCQRLEAMGISCYRGEPLKVTVNAHSLGATGRELALYLAERGVEVEFYDRELLVLMATPQNSAADFVRLEGALASFVETREILSETSSETSREKSSETLREDFPNPPAIPSLPLALSIRRALLSPVETVSLEDAEGRIAASPTVSCPPAIPIVISGEVITKKAVAALRYYGFDRVSVIMK